MYTGITLHRSYLTVGELQQGGTGRGYVTQHYNLGGPPMYWSPPPTFTTTFILICWSYTITPGPL